MNIHLRILAVLVTATVLKACGGGDGGGEPVPVSEPPPPEVVAHAWDTWNWDEGGFGD
jgi:hypothetical protein